ncbi:hypothetical protein CMU93_11305 [Elizabethkingia anophelis]|nr:hypothetical protein [Elizabethkingia anophelis]
MKKLLFTTAIGLLSLASCSSNDRGSEPVPVDPSATVKTQDVKDVNANLSAGTFALYSLKDNKQIESTAIGTDKWDIGFNGTTIIVNGGSARKGKGGAALMKGTFDEIKTAPDDTTFKVDNGDKNPDLAIETGGGKGWYSYNGVTNVVSPIAGVIIVVRTAEGKYAKVQIKSYYKGAPANVSAEDAATNFRYYNFKFALQTDGSKTFSK